MEGLSLLQRARRAGLDVWAEGPDLVVTGPEELEYLVHELLAAKPQVLAALEAESIRVAAAERDAVPLTPDLFRIRTVEDLLAVWNAGAPPAACYSCRSARWWRIVGRPSISRPWVCGTCHPPLVAPERIEWCEGRRQ